MSLELILASCIVALLVILLPTFSSVKLGPSNIETTKTALSESSISSAAAAKARFSAKNFIWICYFICPFLVWKLSSCFHGQEIECRELSLFSGLFEMFAFVGLLLLDLSFCVRHSVAMSAETIL